MAVSKREAWTGDSNMKKIVLLLGAACASALAQTTIVTQAVVGPDGQPTDGTAFIAISAACQSGTSYVGNRTIVVRFKDGAFSVGLVPNDSCITSGGSTSTDRKSVEYVKRV